MLTGVFYSILMITNPKSISTSLVLKTVNKYACIADLGFVGTPLKSHPEVYVPVQKMRMDLRLLENAAMLIELKAK